MPINLCSDCGRITGRRTCPWHAGNDNTRRQAPPFTAQAPEVRRLEPVRAHITWRIDRPFKGWRKAHQEKVARKARA
jgi:hypothetical protein